VTEGPEATPPPASVAGRRRLITQAIREGADAPPEGLEDLAERVALRQAHLGWIGILYAIGVLVEAVSVVLADTTGQRLLYAALGLAFLALGLQQRRQVRRARAVLRKWVPPAST
jgi:hypothetical protein